MPAILTYHHIGDPPPESAKAGLYVAAPDFEAQLDWLVREDYRFLSLTELREGLLGNTRPPRRSVVLTFDDGFADNHELALPLLKRHGARATFFPVAGFIGSDNDPGENYMTPDQLRELAGAGMEIGSHAMSHAELAKMPLEKARAELADSKAELESVLGREIDWLSYPKGSFNRDVAAAAREAGYAGACSVIRDNRPTARQLYWLPRVMVMRDVSPRRFRHYFGRLYHIEHAWKNRRRWSEYR
jgi:peptidoglycan/xylan/chitin deacetylase (PgdA/CDA1 family)